jgi:predicted RNase H-like HicB family nuclease
VVRSWKEGKNMSGKTVNKIKNIETNIPVLFLKERKKFIAYSPAIQLSTCGDTEEQARQRFSEAAQIFFDEIVQMGTVEDVLTECGW